MRSVRVQRRRQYLLNMSRKLWKWVLLPSRKIRWAVRPIEGRSWWSAIRFRAFHSRCWRFKCRVQAVSEGMFLSIADDKGWRFRTVHALNLIQRGCRMLSCWNCRNGYLRIQRIGSSRRSSVRVSVVSIVGRIEDLSGYHKELWERRRRRVKWQQPDRHITTNYAKQADIVCIHNAKWKKKTT